MGLVRSAIIAVALLIPASGAQSATLIDKTGPISDIFLGYTGEFTFDIYLRGLVGNPTSHPPFTPPPVGGPPTEWFGPRVHYSISLTTPSPLIMPLAGSFDADYYDLYMNVGGEWINTGGNDNSGAGYVSCLLGNCGAPFQSGNTITFAFDSQDYASWDVYNIIGPTQYSRWLNRAELYGELPIQDLQGDYHLVVLASAVPEPATWAVMILGMFGTGSVLRRRRVSAQPLRRML